MSWQDLIRRQMGSGKMAIRSSLKCRNLWLRLGRGKVLSKSTLQLFLKDWKNNSKKNRKKLKKNMIPIQNKYNSWKASVKIFAENCNQQHKTN